MRLSALYTAAQKAASPFIGHVLNSVLPSRCVSCGSEVSSPGSVCGECWSRLHFISKSHCCTSCGHPYDSEAESGLLCGVCIQEPPPYHMARAALRYDEHCRPLITNFKYSDALHTTDLFARWMLSAGHDCLKGADILVPVPLHPLRRIQRRYNQSALLVQRLNVHTKIPVGMQVLERTRHTPPQAERSRVERLSNVRGAFAVVLKRTHHIQNKHVVLVDDVMTTGATVQECSRQLMKAGAGSVRVLTVARTVVEG